MSSSDNGFGSFLVILFMLFLLIVGGVFVTQASVQLGLHAPSKHGVEAVAAVSAMFSANGTCNKGPSVEMRSITGRWMNLCFFDEGAAAWITTKRVSDEGGREITAIPREQMSEPIRYLRSVIKREGYSLEASHGQLPEWFMQILRELAVIQ